MASNFCNVFQRWSREFRDSIWIWGIFKNTTWIIVGPPKQACVFENIMNEEGKLFHKSIPCKSLIIFSLKRQVRQTPYLYLRLSLIWASTYPTRQTKCNPKWSEHDLSDQSLHPFWAITFTFSNHYNPFWVHKRIFLVIVQCTSNDHSLLSIIPTLFHTTEVSFVSLNGGPESGRGNNTPDVWPHIPHLNVWVICYGCTWPHDQTHVVTTLHFV